MLGLLITAAIVVVAVAKLANLEKPKPWTRPKLEYHDPPKPKNRSNYPPPVTY